MWGPKHSILADMKIIGITTKSIAPPTKLYLQTATDRSNTSLFNKNRKYLSCLSILERESLPDMHYLLE